MKKFYHYCLPFILMIYLVGCAGTKKVDVLKNVSILTRQEWGAASSVLPMRKHFPTKITLHHTAVKQNLNRSLTDKLKSLQKFSMERSPLSDGRIKEPWADIPYHFYIAANGAIGEGRPLQYVGDYNTPYDPTGHALIVLEGNFNEENVSAEQKQSLKKLVIALARKYKINAPNLSGHKDHATTACPGNNLYDLIPELKEWLTTEKKNRK